MPACAETNKETEESLTRCGLSAVVLVRACPKVDLFIAHLIAHLIECSGFRAFSIKWRIKWSIKWDKTAALGQALMLRALFGFLFELAEAPINRIQSPDNFLIVSAVLVLDLNQRRKGDATLQQKHH